MNKVEVKLPDFPREDGTETGCKFNQPTRDRKYIKILALCLVPCQAKVIFPGVKNPIMKQVRDLCRAGYLDRLEAEGERAYYYKTTIKGFELIKKALEAK